jgi:hypothetical protein
MFSRFGGSPAVCGVVTAAVLLGGCASHGVRVRSQHAGHGGAGFSALLDAPARPPARLVDVAGTPGMQASYGPLVSSARAVRSPVGRGEWFLVPARGGLCLSAGGLVCASLGQAYAGGLRFFVPLRGSRRVRVIGAVPDGVRFVHAGDGAVGVVSHNVYELVTADPGRLRMVK